MKKSHTESGGVGSCPTVIPSSTLTHEMKRKNNNNQLKGTSGINGWHVVVCVYFLHTTEEEVAPDTGAAGYLVSFSLF